MFKATDTLAAGRVVSRTVADNGGNDNAFTSYDYTAYYQRVAADRLSLMMGMEADRMNNLQLTDEDIDHRAAGHPGGAEHSGWTTNPNAHRPRAGATRRCS